MKLLTKKEASLALRISLSTLDRLYRKRKLLAYVKVGDRVFFSEDMIEAFIHESTINNKPIKANELNKENSNKG